MDKCFDVSVPGAWKTWWFNYDYALGFIAGWGVHPLDIAYWGHPEMMKGPMTVEGKAIIPTEGACNTGIAWDVGFKFADGVAMQYRGTRNGYDQENALNDMRPWEQKVRPDPRPWHGFRRHRRLGGRLTGAGSGRSPAHLAEGACRFQPRAADPELKPRP